MRATRFLPAGALCVAVLLGSPLAWADPPQPMLGTFSPADREAALLESQNAIPAPPSEWESTEGQMDVAGGAPGEGLRATDDDDTAHYQRGQTLAILVFINHTGGTWTVAEMDAAGAKSSIAKDYYLDRAPAEANTYFDFQGTNSYWYYTGTVNYNIPANPTAAFMNQAIEDALANIGFGDGDGDGTRVDDFTFYLQNWGGGWDNVLGCFQPDQTGRAWASYGYAKTHLYTNSDANVWAHEWGHLWGACDEYVEGGQCNGGINCGDCQSWYLDEIVDNGNCQLVSCPSDVDCLMINNTFTNLCAYTPEHWAWVDEDNNGLLDNVKRRTTGNNFVDIWDLFHNGYFYWNNVDHSMSIRQQWTSWAVVGLRSPATADYDLRLYGDNNHQFQYASSSYGGTTVDFVVGDYNHSPLGNEHIGLIRYSGDTAYYNLTWESGTGMLYPDGVARAGNWADYNIVRVWDVPLFAGENVTFAIDVTSGTPDFGMALFRSSDNPYWTGRSGAQWARDVNGAGQSESWTYAVPADDVYGLVVWSNNAVNGAFTIQIGPTPVSLAEETPFYSALDLRLFNYDPNAVYWSFVGTRPDAATGVRIGLYDDASYQTPLESSANYGAEAIEFVAADYNHASGAVDYLRVIKDSGSGNHRTEWEHDADIIEGALPVANWIATHVGKVWDAFLTAGETYFLREYHSTAEDLDTGIYAFYSGDGDLYKQRSAYAAAANFRPPSDGGEWFSYLAPSSDWYGIYQIVNNDADALYTIWLGAKVNLAEDVVATRADEVVWGSNNVSSVYWTAFGARPPAGGEADVWLYGDDAYTITTFKVSDGGAGVNFVVGDYNHDPLGVVYPLFRRAAGSGTIDCEWEGGSEQLAFVENGFRTYDLNWPAADVVEVWDMYIAGAGLRSQGVRIEVQDLSGALDLGVAFFASDGGEYYANPSNAVALSDAYGIGGGERIDVNVNRDDWYGVVVFNQNRNGGNYRIVVSDPAVASAEDVTAPRFDLRQTSENPFGDAVRIAYSVPKAGWTDLSIYDVGGRFVRSLVREGVPAGSHDVIWDGRDSRGNPVAAGLYLARLQSEKEEKLLKLVRSR